MPAALEIAFNCDETRAALQLFHPKGNIITGEIIRHCRVRSSRLPIVRT